MDKFGDLFRTKWAAFGIWVLVMYLTAFLWNVMDDDSWYAFPTYVISVLAWIGSFVGVARFFVEWTGSGKRGEGTWKYLYGKGKLKGITGGGNWMVVKRGKSVAKGTFQNCIRVTGTFDLPMK